MSEEQPGNEFNVDEFVKKLEMVSPGHKDTKGKLTPENEGNEVRNQFGVIVNYAYLWGAQGAGEDVVDKVKTSGVNKLLDLYPGQKDLLKRLVNETDSFSNQRSIFEEEEK